MDILKVISPLVCTQRISALAHVGLRVLADDRGRLVVATDPVGTRPGNWVFTTSGSAARYAMGDPGVLTDLTIAGIIDCWEGPQARDNASAAGVRRPVRGGSAAPGT